MTVTKRMREITSLYEQGTPIEQIAAEYDITAGSALKKVKKTQQYDRQSLSKSIVSTHNMTTRVTPTIKLDNNHAVTVAHRRARTWDLVTIKSGIDNFIANYGKMPTANDFSNANNLPSARQVQRMYGGLENLRKELGYKEHNFTKGELRKKIATDANIRGLDAEDAFEPILIEKFGEPYVHVQKRYYKGSKNRYDFFVYAKNRAFGIDIFTTSRSSYIVNNIRHKILRYKNAPKELSIYFVLVGDKYSSTEVKKACDSIVELASYPNMAVLNEGDFISLIEAFEPLGIPGNFLGLEMIES
jgi:hypothetical protein